MIGTVTHEVTSVLVTSEGNYPQLPALLARTHAHHDVREVSANKAYSPIHNHEVLDRLGVAAYIPFKDNADVNPKSPERQRTADRPDRAAVPAAAHRRMGALAKALRYEWDSFQKVATSKRPVTPALILQFARFAGFAGIPMDKPLTGQWLSARVCPRCGAPAR
jgi:hypothetical protein